MTYSLDAIADNCYPNTTVLINRLGTNIDFEPFLKAILAHLTTIVGLSEEKSREAISIIESRSICVANFFDGNLRFGAPVSDE